MVCLAGHDRFKGIDMSRKSPIGADDVFAKGDGGRDALFRMPRDLRFDRRIVPRLPVRGHIDPARTELGCNQTENGLLHTADQRGTGRVPNAGKADRVWPAGTMNRHLELKPQALKQMRLDAKKVTSTADAVNSPA